MSEEFEIDGFVYRANPMDLRVQLHLVRRVTPLVASVPALLTAKGDFLTAVMPFAEALAGMEDKDVDYIIDKSLSIIERKQPGDRQWAKVWNSSAQRVMFDDITLMTMLKLSARVILDNIGSFLPALAPLLNGAAGALTSMP